MAVQKVKWENQKKGVAESYERRFRRKDGTILWTITSASPIFDKDGMFAGSYSMMTDISDRKTAEEEKDRIQSQLVQAQKMEAIGTLAGGIAHDFNNMLGGIMGSLNLMELLLAREELQQRESIDKYIETSLGSCRRAADMTRQLLALSKKGDLRLMPTDINVSLRNVMEIAKSSFPKSITLDFAIADTPLRVMADPTQIEQVLLNLCVNASHAMTLMREDGSREGGTLAVRAGPVNGSAVPRPRHPDARAGEEYVGIAISDTGVGMDAETLDRVFDPFFTTKKKQQGTGLGLAMAYGIVRQHGGFITVRSTPGVGSVFTVYLPALNEAAADTAAEKKTGSIVRGSGRVLIFDDEKAILRVARGILEQCGYKTVTARSGPEGLEIYRREHRNIDGVLLDLSMPGMSGLEVYERLRAINPAVRVLLSSGYMEEDTLKKAGERGIKGFIHKPYTAEELSEKMSELLR
ncbi:MAG TPA: response regulator [Spirochaetes bacterium]|nr:response regulator [Spirochaetota bacterium]